MADATIKKQEYVIASTPIIFVKNGTEIIEVLNILREDLKIVINNEVITANSMSNASLPVKEWKNVSECYSEFSTATLDKYKLSKIITWLTATGTSSSDWKAGSLEVRAGIKCSNKLELYVYFPFYDCETGTEHGVDATNPLSWHFSSVTSPEMLEWIQNGADPLKNTLKFNAIKSSTVDYVVKKGNNADPRLP